MRAVNITPMGPADIRSCLSLPVFLSKVAAGFASPADDYLDGGLDLNKYLIEHPSSTYFARADGDSMIELGIFSGDLLVVDRAVPISDGDVVVVAVDGQLTIKILDLVNRQLLPANRLYRPIPVAEGSQVETEGVVIHAVHSFKTRRT